MADELPTPARGEVIFHARCLPALQAGDYALHVGHSLQRGGQRLDVGSKPLPANRVYPITVDGPRFTLDPSLIHAVFPPTNGVGSYVTRLPMIVLRRRTLPWERSLAPGSDSPWLAVLLFEEGEATTLSPCKVRDVLDGAPGLQSPRLNLPDVPAAALDQPCLGLELPLELFQEIAPMASEVPLLTHVRQVNTEDKELLGMDEDGWFAVVMGNRIPEPGTPGQPRKYHACLVSLEGAQAFLPTEAQCPALTGADLNRLPVLDFAEKIGAWKNLMVSADPQVSVDSIAGQVLKDMEDSGSAWRWMGKASATGTSAEAARSAAKASAHGNSQPAGRSEWTKIALASEGQATPVKPVAVRLLVPKVRLFMLAQWSFECREGGDFEAIMQALPRNGGVAMLGMPPSLAQSAGSPVPTATWRAALDTGHVPLQHLTREGEQTIAWYRGPLTSVGVAREANGPYHHADQARRVDPATGLENLGYAAAFEIGRLLALADPRFALELLHWRRDGRLTLVGALIDRILKTRLPPAYRPRLPNLLDPRSLNQLPRVLGALTAGSVDSLMQAQRLGVLRDPTGLQALRSRLPGLDGAVVAEAKGLRLEVTQSILGSVALGGSVLDTLGFAEVAPMESRLEVLAAEPQWHFGTLREAFDLQLNSAVRGMKR